MPPRSNLETKQSTPFLSEIGGKERSEKTTRIEETIGSRDYIGSLLSCSAEMHCSIPRRLAQRAGNQGGNITGQEGAQHGS